MPQSSALQLKEYPTDMVRLVCTRCDREGQYRLETIIAKHGVQTRLPGALRVGGQRNNADGPRPVTPQARRAPASVAVAAPGRALGPTLGEVAI